MGWESEKNAEIEMQGPDGSRPAVQQDVNSTQREIIFRANLWRAIVEVARLCRGNSWVNSDYVEL